MTRAGLVGHTGFVGGNLAAQHGFDACYNSRNIEEIAGQSFGLLVVSGMPAAMWVANQDPAADRAVLDRLAGCLRKVRAGRVVVISTVAVYPDPVGVDEDSPIDPEAQTPYGRHRWLLERQLADHFGTTTALRLPGLFGPGLKKNALYDLIHDHDLHKLNTASVYQFYDLTRLWADVSRALDSGLSVLNLATEPVSLGAVAAEVFDRPFTNDPGTPAARYDMRTRHAALFGGRGGYLEDRGQVLDRLRAFVRREREIGGRAMKLAVSNIAWPVERDAEVAEALAGCGVAGVEIAPTKVWPSPPEATDAEVDAYRRFWEARGLPVVAAQALLFGRPELTLFDDPETRARTLDYLTWVVRVCGRLGAQALVFGSPKNRRAGGRDPGAVWGEAVEFFGRLGEAAAAAGTAVVMEANPPEYGADFVTRAAEALALVRAVNHPGFRLHLDAACMAMAGDDPDAVVAAAGPLLAHFHASEPNLGPVGDGTTDHPRCARALAASGYGGWVSIEMRQAEPFGLAALGRAVGLVQERYGSVGVSSL